MLPIGGAEEAEVIVLLERRLEGQDLLDHLVLGFLLEIQQRSID